jgi:hypothetical protein
MPARTGLLGSRVMLLYIVIIAPPSTALLKIPNAPYYTQAGNQDPAKSLIEKQMPDYGLFECQGSPDMDRCHTGRHVTMLDEGL